MGSQISNRLYFFQINRPNIAHSASLLLNVKDASTTAPCRRTIWIRGFPSVAIAVAVHAVDSKTIQKFIGSIEVASSWSGCGSIDQMGLRYSISRR